MILALRPPRQKEWQTVVQSRLGLRYATLPAYVRKVPYNRNLALVVIQIDVIGFTRYLPASRSSMPNRSRTAGQLHAYQRHLFVSKFPILTFHVSWGAGGRGQEPNEGRNCQIGVLISNGDLRDALWPDLDRSLPRLFSPVLATLCPGQERVRVGESAGPAETTCVLFPTRSFQ